MNLCHINRCDWVFWDTQRLQQQYCCDHGLRLDQKTNKKLNCRREAARCFASLTILLSFKVTQDHPKWPPWVGRV